MRRIKDSNDFKGQTLEGNLSMHESAVPKVIDAMVASLSKRYSDTTQEGAVLNATKVANLKLWPAELKGISWITFNQFNTN